MLAKSSLFTFRRLALPLFVATLSSASWAQSVLYTTFPGAEEGGPCFGDTRQAATGVEVPAGQDFLLGEVVVRLHDVSGSANTPFSVDLYDDDAGSPGTAIASLGSGTGTWNGSETFDTYSLTPPGSVVLAQGETYWVVLSSSGPSTCEFGWSDDGTDPAGSLLSYVGERTGSIGSWSNNDGSLQQLELRAAGSLSSAPVPLLGWPALLTLSLLAAGLGARRLKR
jgi:hypothetical protein